MLPRPACAHALHNDFTRTALAVVAACRTRALPAAHRRARSPAAGPGDRAGEFDSEYSSRRSGAPLHAQERARNAPTQPVLTSFDQF